MPKARLDSRSTILYSPHLVTCSFTWVSCVPQRGHHRRQDLVDTEPPQVPWRQPCLGRSSGVRVAGPPPTHTQKAIN